MRARGGFSAVRVLLALFFLVAAIVPLFVLVSGLLSPDARDVFASPQFSAAVGNSVVTALAGTVISLALAIAMSWVLCRTRIRGKGAIAVVLTVPMLVPSLAHGMGLVFLIGSNGLLTNLLGAESVLYGYVGIILGAVIYSFPSAFLLVYDVMRYEDYAPYEAANVLGIPRASQFARITMPYLRRPLISAAFATFTLIVTDYGVPLMVGGTVTTLPVLMYQEVVGLLNYDTGISIGLVLLVPAVVAFLVDVLNSDKGKMSFVTRSFETRPNRARDAFGYAFAAVVCVVLVAPIATFLVVAFVEKYPIDMAFTLDNIGRSMNMNAGEYLGNSLLVAIAVSFIGTIIAYAAAYLTARVGGKSARVLHLVCITTLAIPGIVLGLAYALTFRGTLLAGTFAILILVNLVHFFASPYLMAYNSLGKVNENLEAVGATLGVSRARIVRDVIVPQTAGTVLEMFSYFFVNCMVTISAVSFLATTLDMPLALLITDLDTQRLTECAAFVSLLILATNVVLKVVVAAAKRVAVRATMGHTA